MLDVFVFKGHLVITLCNKNVKRLINLVQFCNDKWVKKDFPIPKTKLIKFVLQGQNGNFIVRIQQNMSVCTVKKLSSFSIFCNKQAIAKTKISKNR